MRAIALSLSLLFATVVFAGCATDPDEEEIDPPDDGDPGDGGAPGDGTQPPARGNDTTPPPTDETVIDDFSANETGGEAPLEVEFHLDARSADDEAEWTIDFGDDQDLSGQVSELPANIVHTYETEGNYTATATVEGPDAQPSESLEITVIGAQTEPAQMQFEYGEALGCFGDIMGTCVSREQGPDGTPIDGYWQELDARYWGMSFTTTIESQLGDSDCWAVGADGENIEEDLNNGADVCGGTLPSGTQWLYLYPYGEPATGMTLAFGGGGDGTGG